MIKNKINITRGHFCCNYGQYCNWKIVKTVLLSKTSQLFLIYYYQIFHEWHIVHDVLNPLIVNSTSWSYKQLHVVSMLFYGQHLSLFWHVLLHSICFLFHNASLLKVTQRHDVILGIRCIIKRVVEI